MALVLLHPIGLDARCWKFTDLPEAVALDLPGHGGRAVHRRALSLEDLADDVAAALDGPADVVGLSLGGAVAQHLALRHAGLVRSLVLGCTSPKTNRTALEARARAAEDHGMAGVVEPTLQRWFTTEALAAPDHPGVSYARRRLLTHDARTFADFWRALSRHDVVARLSGIDVPVTVIAGSRDQASALGGMELMTALLPNGRLRTIEGPHMLQLESPLALSAVIRSHLGEVGSVPM